MNGITPGDRLIFRDGDRFGLARVDLVSERHVTAFTFDPRRQRYQRSRRRIPASFILAKLPEEAREDLLAARIDVLHHQREAMRQKANVWLREAVGELVLREARRK